MRDKWYGDNRDVVKWGAICAVARQRSIFNVLQIALYRPDKPDYKLNIGETIIPLPEKVVQHFRNIDHIQRLAACVKLKIDIYKDLFQWNSQFRTKKDFRKDYFNRLSLGIKQYSKPVIVFFDPDTGIAPKNCEYEHVTDKEIQKVLRAMKAGDVLLFYQHARQRDKDWLNSTRQKFCEAVGMSVPVETITCDKIATDVAFFMVEWNDWIDAQADKSNSEKFIK